MINNVKPTPVEAEVTEVKKRRGVTLIEALFVLGIMAVLIGMVMVMLSQTNSSNKTNQLSEEITTIVDTAHELYQGQPDYNNIDSTTLAKSGLFPNRWVNGSGLVSPFGAPITLTSVTQNGVAAFKISIPTVPQAACVKIATTDYGNGLLARTPTGTPSSKSGATATGAPSSPTDATANCSANPTMEFTFQ